MNKLAIFATCLISITAVAGGNKKLDIKQSDLSWVAPFGPKGPSLAFVEGKYGDKEPASFFVKFGAGGDSGWHTHDEEYKAIVIAGSFTEQQQGESAETVLPPGTYFTQPAKVPHRNGCLKGTDCLVFVHFDKGASSTMTTPDGKPLPMKK
jgi:quercetin dioxygenase-like cupin family protein